MLIIIGFRLVFFPNWKRNPTWDPIPEGVYWLKVEEICIWFRTIHTAQISHKTALMTTCELSWHVQISGR